jgi:hypothetical protein
VTLLEKPDGKRLLGRRGRRVEDNIKKNLKELGGGTGFIYLTIHPHLAPKLNKDRSYTFTPPLGLRGLF